MKKYMARFCRVQRSCAEVEIEAPDIGEARRIAEELRAHPDRLDFSASEEEVDLEIDALERSRTVETQH